MGLELNRGHAQFDSESYNKFMRAKLLSDEQALVTKETYLSKQERSLAPIVERAEPYPLPRMHDGKLISLKKAGITLINVRNELSTVSAQRQDTQNRLRQLR